MLLIKISSSRREKPLFQVLKPYRPHVVRAYLGELTAHFKGQSALLPCIKVPNRTFQPRAQRGAEATELNQNIK